jgi:hypothetical protein
MEEHSAAELTDHQRLNRLGEVDKVKDIHLEKSLIDVAKVLGGIVLKVLDIEGFRHHIESTLHMLRCIIVIIPHSTLRISPEPLVIASVLPLMKAVQVCKAKFTPSVDMGCTQVPCDLLLLLHVHGPTSPLSPSGRRRPTSVNNLGPHMRPSSCRTATIRCRLP